MLQQVTIFAMLALGVLGRSVPGNSNFEGMFPTAYCKDENMPPVTAALFTFKLCMMGIYTNEQNIRIFRQAYSSNNYDLIFKTFCASSQQLKTCSRPVFSTMTSCVSAGVLQSSQQEFDESIDYLCQNEGAMMSLLYKKGPTCMEQQKTALASCEATKSSGVQRLMNVYGSGPAIPANDICSLEVANSACQVAAFKACSDPEMGSVAEQTHNRFYANRNCGETTTTRRPAGGIPWTTTLSLF